MELLALLALTFGAMALCAGAVGVGALWGRPPAAGGCGCAGRGHPALDACPLRSAACGTGARAGEGGGGRP